MDDALSDVLNNLTHLESSTPSDGYMAYTKSEVGDMDMTSSSSISLSTLVDISPAGNTTTTTMTTNERNLLVPAVMFLLGVFGNILALVILTVKPSKDSKYFIANNEVSGNEEEAVEYDRKSTAFYHLVKALACMDLFGIVATSPVTIVVYLNDSVTETGGMALCHYVAIMLMMAGNATVFTVLVMAGERFMVTHFPYQYSRVVNPRSVNITIAIVWGISGVIALMPLFGLVHNAEHFPRTWCFFDYRSSNLGDQIYGYFYAIAGLLAILITIILNLTVIQHLLRMRVTRIRYSLHGSSLRNFQTNVKEKQSGKGAIDSELRMIAFLMAIIIVFTVCYAPLMIRIIMNVMLNAGRDILVGGLEDQLDLWSLRLACVNQILDPWVYIISRVTCCKGQRDRETERPRSYSMPTTQTPLATPPTSRPHVNSSAPCSAKSSPSYGNSYPIEKRRNLLTRAVVTLRSIFKEESPRKVRSSDTAVAEPESQPMPLQPATVTLKAERDGLIEEDPIKSNDCVF